MTAARPASEPPWSSQAPERSAPPPDGLASRPAEISPAWEGGEEKQSSATAEHPPAPRYGPRIRFGRAPRGGRMGVVWRTRAAREGIWASRSRGARSALPMAPCGGDNGAGPRKDDGCSSTDGTLLGRPLDRPLWRGGPTRGRNHAATQPLRVGTRQQNHVSDAVLAPERDCISHVPASFMDLGRSKKNRNQKQSRSPLSHAPQARFFKVVGRLRDPAQSIACKQLAIPPPPFALLRFVRRTAVPEIQSVEERENVPPGCQNRLLFQREINLFFVLRNYCTRDATLLDF